jgi:hypothetical protein
MRKKPCQASTKSNARYVVRYFDCDWTECEQLRTRGTLSDVMINVGMWCRSRELDKDDQSLIVFSVYHHYPYISVEEEGHPYGKEQEKE